MDKTWLTNDIPRDGNSRPVNASVDYSGRGGGGRSRTLSFSWVASSPSCLPGYQAAACDTDTPVSLNYIIQHQKSLVQTIKLRCDQIFLEIISMNPSGKIKVWTKFPHFN